MSPSQPQQQLRYKCFPRVSGDEPFTNGHPNGENPFSPRERG